MIFRNKYGKFQLLSMTRGIDPTGNAANYVTYAFHVNGHSPSLELKFYTSENNRRNIRGNDILADFILNLPFIENYFVQNKEKGE